MGKAQKLKQERKIVGLRQELKREARWRLFRSIAGGVSIGIILGSLLFLGYKSLDLGSINLFNKKEGKVQSYKTGDHKYSKAPDMQIDTSKTYIANFETAAGAFQVTLNAKDAPKTVNNFVTLARDRFYDGLTFHRIVKDFMIQGGDPEGTGTGGPGYKFDDEKVVGDYNVGTIAMANSGKNTNGSQFFIMTGDYSGGKLSKDYVIFGKVTSGLETVLKLNNTETKDSGSGEKSSPTEKVIINKVTITEK